MSLQLQVVCIAQESLIKKSKQNEFKGCWKKAGCIRHHHKTLNFGQTRKWAQVFGLSKRIWCWENQPYLTLNPPKIQLREFAVSCEGSTDGRHTMKACFDERLDKAQFTWFTQERHRRTPLSGPIVKEKAIWFYQQLNPDDNRTFTASGGWLQRWKKRYSIWQLSIQGEVLSSAGIETEPFNEDLTILMEEHQIGRHQLSLCQCQWIS